MNLALVIMLKAPHPGRVKTRLAQQYGYRGAARIHRRLAEGTFDRLRCVRGVDIHIAVSPGRWNPLFRHAPVEGQDRIIVQVPGDLGIRMRRISQILLRTYTGVIIIGSDCPGLDAALMEEAIVRLHDHDVVIGPAYDGGYYLIGVRRNLPWLFSGIDWGSRAVLHQTQVRLRRYHVQASLLPSLADIDEPGDVRMWKMHYRLAGKSTGWLC